MNLLKYMKKKQISKNRLKTASFQYVIYIAEIRYQFTSCEPIQKRFGSVLCQEQFSSCNSFNSIAEKNTSILLCLLFLFVLKHTHTHSCNGSCFNKLTNFHHLSCVQCAKMQSNEKLALDQLIQRVQFNCLDVTKPIPFGMSSSINPCKVNVEIAFERQ